MPNRHENPPLDSGNETPNTQNNGSDVYAPGQAINQGSGGVESGTAGNNPTSLSGDGIEGPELDCSEGTVVNDAFANEWDNNQLI
jgi:hypothetical protein